MTKIAVYGTLRQGYGNHPVLGKSPLIGSGWTKEKYKLPNDFLFFLGNTDPKKNTPNVLKAFADFNW